MDDIINILIIIVFIVLPLIDKFFGKKKKRPVVPAELLKERARKKQAQAPSEDEVRRAKDVLRHRGELLPNETMWTPEPEETPVIVLDDMMADEAAAELKDETHTAAYEAQRKFQEAATRAAEEAAYERAAKLPSAQSAKPAPRIELTAEKAREAIVLATILGAPKSKSKRKF